MESEVGLCKTVRVSAVCCVQKGKGYHLDLLVVAILVVIHSLLGLPWYVAATVNAIAHINSLKKESECTAPGEKPTFLGCRFVLAWSGRGGGERGLKAGGVVAVVFFGGCDCIIDDSCHKSSVAAASGFVAVKCSFAGTNTDVHL